MSIHLIIDGYNFTGRSEGSFRDIESYRDSLIEKLSIYKKLRRVAITVVFDGTHSGRLTRSRDMKAGVEIIFSKSGEQADSVLKNMAKSKGGSLTIVTSDRDIASYAGSFGSVVISSDEFRELLDYALYEDLKGVSSEEEEEDHKKKGPSKRPPKAERKKKNRLKKL